MSTRMIALGIVISCAGNSEGAKKAWEKRKRGSGGSLPPVVPKGGRVIEFGETGKCITLPHPSDPTFPKQFSKAIDIAKSLEDTHPDAAAEIYVGLNLPQRAMRLNQRKGSSSMRALKSESRGTREGKAGIES